MHTSILGLRFDLHGIRHGGKRLGWGESRRRGISSPANFWNMLNAWNGLNSWGSAQMWMWSRLGWGIEGGGLNDWKNWVSTTLALCWSYQQYQYWTMVDWFHLSTWGSAWRQKVLYCRSWLFFTKGPLLVPQPEKNPAPGEAVGSKKAVVIHKQPSKQI